MTVLEAFFRSLLSPACAALKGGATLTIAFVDATPGGRTNFLWAPGASLRTVSFSPLIDPLLRSPGNSGEVKNR